MKTLFIILLCMVASTVFCQTNEAMVEEKSSDWIKVILTTPPAIKPKAAHIIKKKKNTEKAPVSKPDPQQEFEKTNQQVNRFKKKNGTSN